MPTTPILGLPYPVGADPADVPADMADLANQIEAKRGSSNGLAALDASGKVPSTQLPGGAPTRVMEIAVTDPLGNPVVVGDGRATVFVPAMLNGYTITDAQAAVATPSVSGLITIQVANVTDGVDILSTRITIDVGEKTSYTAAAPPVINTAADDVSTGDELRVDVDGAGTNAYGLVVMLTFTPPP